MSSRTKTFKVDGIAGVDQALTALGKRLGKSVLRRVARQALEPMAETARQLAPDDPETAASIADTIIVTGRRPKGEMTANARAFGAALRAGLGRDAARAAAQAAGAGDVQMFMGPNRHPKAVQQEFGNSRHRAQPYMRPAWDRHKQQVIADIGDQLWAEIGKSAARKAKRERRG